MKTVALNKKELTKVRSFLRDQSEFALVRNQENESICLFHGAPDETQNEVITSFLPDADMYISCYGMYMPHKLLCRHLMPTWGPITVSISSSCSSIIIRGATEEEAA